VTGSSDALFAFRYPRFGNLGTLVAAVVVAVAWGSWDAVRGGARIETLLPWMVGLPLFLLTVYFTFTTFTPFAVDGKRVRVDREGLQLGRFQLPASHLGEVELLDAETARVAAHRLGSLVRMRWEVEGRRISGRHLAYPWDALPAVLIEDTRRSSRPWWMLAVPEDVDPEAFAAALRQVAAGRSEPTGG
jgi:hypothetical protein